MLWELDLARVRRGLRRARPPAPAGPRGRLGQWWPLPPARPVSAADRPRPAYKTREQCSSALEFLRQEDPEEAAIRVLVHVHEHHVDVSTYDLLHSKSIGGDALWNKRYLWLQWIFGNERHVGLHWLFWS